MKQVLLNVVIFIVATLATAVLGAIFSTQFVISGLQSVGVEIPFSARISMTIDDLAILPVLLIAVTACFAVAFPVAAYCSRKFGGSRKTWFAIGGGIALITELLILSYFLGGMLIGGARTIPGLAFQGIAGALGGYLFAWITELTRPKSE